MGSNCNGVLLGLNKHPVARNLPRQLGCMSPDKTGTGRQVRVSICSRLRDEIVKVKDHRNIMKLLPKRNNSTINIINSDQKQSCENN